MSARCRYITSSVHICLTVVTGFLIVIFHRNQLQRSSSKETLCAREVHRMVLGGLNVQILHQKMLYTSYMFQWNEAKIWEFLFAYFEVCLNLGLLWSVSNQGPHDHHQSMLTNVLQRHLPCLRPTQSVIYVPLQVSRFAESALLIVQFRIFLFSRIWSSAQDHAILVLLLNLVGFVISIWQNLSCGNDLLAVYQFRKGISAGPALKYFIWFTGAGGHRSNVLAKNRRNWQVNFIDSGLEVAKTRFQTFLRGKSVLFKWKSQIREFHARAMERGEFLKR